MYYLVCLSFLIILLFWIYLLKKQELSNNYLFSVVLFSFSMQYIIPVFYYIVSSDFANRFYESTLEDFLKMQYCCFLFLLGIFIGQKIILTPKCSVETLYFSSSSDGLTKLKFVLFCVSMLAVYIQYESFQYLFSENLLSDRLIENRGKGYLQFLNVTSYFLVLVAIKQYLHKKISFPYLLLHTVPAFLIFSFKLQRGHALYPLFFTLLAFFYVNFRKKITNKMIFVLLLSLFFVGNLTSVIRTRIVTGKDVSIEQKFKEEIIPMSYAHSELLSAIIADDRVKTLPNTLYASCINWIPRSLFVDKPLTTGPILSNHYSPDSEAYDLENHRSSYTTDPLIEGYYNMGYIGVFVFSLFFTIIANAFWKSVVSNNLTFYLAFPIVLLIIGFKVFFSDLGNWLGYIIIYYGFYFVFLKKRTFKI